MLHLITIIQRKKILAPNSLLKHNEIYIFRKLQAVIPKKPRKISGCGNNMGLAVLLDIKIEDYFAQYLPTPGIQMLVHDSYDHADENAERQFVEYGSEAFIEVKPESIYSTKTVRSLSIKKRLCFFEDEWKLDMFQKFSYINCMAECRAKLFHKICDCVPNIFPEIESMKLCNFSQAFCVTDSYGKF